MEKKIFVFYAPPGGGKDTQVEFFRKFVCRNLYSSCIYIGTGEMFRNIYNKTFSSLIKKEVNAGNLILDEITEGLVFAYLLEHLKDNTNIILNGFPRNVAQAGWLSKIAKFFNFEVNVFYLKVKPEEALRRIRSRPGVREDDKDIKTILNRLHLFNMENEFLLEYFGKNFNLISIDGMGTPVEVADRIREVLS